MPYTNFPNGVTSMGVPLPSGNGMPFIITGHVYYAKKTTDTDYSEFNDNHFVDYQDGTTSVQNTIQAAVDCCLSGRGDVVFVCQGKWVEDVVIVGKTGLRLFGQGYGTGSTEPGATRLRPNDATTLYPFTSKLGTVTHGAAFHVLSRNVEIAGFYFDGGGGCCGIYAGGGLNGGVTGYTTENASGLYVHDNFIRGGAEGQIGLYMNGIRFGGIIERNIFERWTSAGIEMDAGNASNESCIIRGNTFLAANASYGVVTYGEGNSALHCQIANNVFSDGASLAFTFGILNNSGSTGVLGVTGNFLNCTNKMSLLATDVHCGNYKGTLNATEVYCTES